VKVWDAVTGQALYTLKGHTGVVCGVAFSPDGTRLVSASADSTIKVWDDSCGRECFDFPEHSGEVRSVAFSPDGTRLAAGGRRDNAEKGILGDVRVWDAMSGQLLLTLNDSAGGVNSVVFSPDGKLLASASGGPDGAKPGVITIWNAASGQELRTLAGHQCWATAVAFSPDGKWLASAGGRPWDDHQRPLPGEVRLWDAASGQELRDLKGHGARVNSVAFSPDGRLLASSSDDRTVKVWDLAGGQVWRNLEGHTDWVTAVAFSPDGKLLASAGEDRTIQVWDLDSGMVRHHLKGHARAVHSVAFSPDGKRLASGSSDETVKVWDARSGQELRTLKSPRSFNLSVAFSPDGWRLASTAGYGVRVWDARPLTPDARTEREAFGLVEFLFAQPLLETEVLARIDGNQMISEPVRHKALALAANYSASPQRLENACWAGVRLPGRPPEMYRQILQAAEVFRRQKPDCDPFLNTLGIAQYRAGNYSEALTTLQQADKIYRNLNLFQDPHPAALAFLAMTCHELGQHKQAQTFLEQLRKIMKTSAWANNTEAAAFQREAEELLRAARP
jgi:WD40 repeat protein